jgi:hypothetical protein
MRRSMERSTLPSRVHDWGWGLRAARRAGRGSSAAHDPSHGAMAPYRPGARGAAGFSSARGAVLLRVGFWGCLRTEGLGAMRGAAPIASRCARRGAAPQSVRFPGLARHALGVLRGSRGWLHLRSYAAGVRARGTRARLPQGGIRGGRGAARWLRAGESAVHPSPHRSPSSTPGCCAPLRSALARRRTLVLRSARLRSQALRGGPLARMED